MSTERRQYPPVPQWLFEASDTIANIAARRGHSLHGLMVVAFLAGCDAMREQNEADPHVGEVDSGESRT